VRRSPLGGGRRSPGSIAISVAIHTVAVAALLSVTLRVPIREYLTSGDRPPIVPEQVSYVAMAPAGGGGGGPAAAPPPVGVPRERLVAPATVPTELPAAAAGGTPPPGAGVPGGVPGGTGTGAGGGDPRNAAVRGVVPGLGDPRLTPGAVGGGVIPRSVERRTQDAIMDAYAVYRDSVIAAQMNPTRQPGDLSWERNGQKYGWDGSGIHFGKFTVPNAVLALLPMPVGGRNINAATDARTSAWVQSDLQYHAAGMSSDEFKAAVKRIRDRKDREREDQKKAAAQQPPTVRPPQK
jgi:hypothetical protein